MPALNIKDPEVHDLAARLARETGESLTGAVKTAIRQRLDAIEAVREPAPASVEALLEWGRRYRAELAREGVELKPLDDDDLYDEFGLPR